MSTEDFVDGWAEKIAAAQLQETVEIAGKTFQRVRYGADFPKGTARCRDCAVEHGQLHVRGCVVERCARCGEQAYGCACSEAEVH